MCVCERAQILSCSTPFPKTRNHFTLYFACSLFLGKKENKITLHMHYSGTCTCTVHVHVHVHACTVSNIHAGHPNDNT